MTTTSYSQELQTLVQVYAEAYNEEDLLAVLEDCRGDLQLAFDRISEGNVSQWQTQKQPKKEKVKPIPSTTARRGGRQSGRGRGGRTVHGSDRSHGGERSAEKEKESVESDNATIANTEDWGNTATVTTEKEWKKASATVDELEQKTAKLSVGGKKNFTVIKKNEKANSSQPKKNNWASVVKGPEVVPEPVQEPEPVIEPVLEKKVEKPQPSTTKTVQKKLVLVKKEQVQAPAVSEPSPSPPIAAIARDWNPVSPRAKSVQASPSIISRAQISPVPKSGVLSPPKQIDPPAIENPSVSLSPRNGTQESSSMPPGLTRPANVPNRPAQAQQRKKPEGAVVLPSSAPSISGQVQFGSFGIAKKAPSTTPKSPEKLEETNSSTFQFNPPQSTSTSASNTRQVSSEQTAPTGAPGLQTQYQQPVFGLGGAGYSMYESEQQRAMGYYVPEQNAYPAKYGQDVNTSPPNTSQTPANQHPQAANPQAHFQPYPYYPYYMNQYQQSPYQPPVYQQQHFGGKNTYGGAGFQTPAVPNGPVAAKGAQQTVSQQPNYYGGVQQFYPTGYEEDPYGGKQNYPPTFFGGQSSSKPDYKQQNRQPRPPYEKPSNQGSAQAQPSQQQPQVNHSAPYYGGQHFSGMHYQQLMMHPQGYPQNPGYSQSHGRGGPQSQHGYWNGN